MRTGRLIVLTIGLLGLFLRAQDQTYTFQTSYNNYGDVSGLQYSNGARAVYQFDGMGRVGGLDYLEPDQTGHPILRSFTYRDDNRLTGAVNMAALGAATATRTLSYDALGRAWGEALNIDGSIAYDASYRAYNEWGFLSGYQRNDEAHTDPLRYRMTYTEQGMLNTYAVQDVGTLDVPCNPANDDCVGFTYDHGGNLTARTALTWANLSIPAMTRAYFDNNQVNGFSYDHEGRLTADGAHIYHYSSLGRLSLVTDQEGAVVAHYLYDSKGMRVRGMDQAGTTYTLRDVQGQVLVSDLHGVGGQATTNHLINGTDLVAEVRHQGGNTPELSYRFNDRHNSAAVGWSAQGTNHYSYTPFGMQAGTGVVGGHAGVGGFQGHEDDAVTGLTYMRARYFDAEGARFNTVDPARDFNAFAPKTYNLYQFTYNNPTNFTDPTGTQTIDDEDLVDAVVVVDTWTVDNYTYDAETKTVEISSQDMVKVEYPNLNGFFRKETRDYEQTKKEGEPRVRVENKQHLSDEEFADLNRGRLSGKPSKYGVKHRNQKRREIKGEKAEKLYAERIKEAQRRYHGDPIWKFVYRKIKNAIQAK